MTDDLKWEENIQNVSDVVVPACQSPNLDTQHIKGKGDPQLGAGKHAQISENSKLPCVGIFQNSEVKE